MDTPVVFCPVVSPSFRGNCTFLVSRSSSGTHSSKRLLTKIRCGQLEQPLEPTKLTINVVNIVIICILVLFYADDFCQRPFLQARHSNRQSTSLDQRRLKLKLINIIFTGSRTENLFSFGISHLRIRFLSAAKKVGSRPTRIRSEVLTVESQIDWSASGSAFMIISELNLSFSIINFASLLMSSGVVCPS